VRNNDGAALGGPNLLALAYPILVAWHFPSLAMDASTDEVVDDGVAPAVVFPVIILVALSGLERFDFDLLAAAFGNQVSCDLTRVVVILVIGPFPLVMTFRIVNGVVLPVIGVMFLPVVVVVFLLVIMFPFVMVITRS